VQALEKKSGESSIIRMLRKAYEDAKDDPDENWRTLDKLPYLRAN
jgi:hypothetical protein